MKIRIGKGIVTAALIALIAFVSTLAPATTPPVAHAAPTPTSGSLSPGSPPLTYRGGPFTVSNAGGQAGMPICNAAQPCDNFPVSITVPNATYAVSVSLSYPQVQNQTELDIYVTDAKGNTVGSSATTNDPNVTSFAVAASGVYTVTIVPSLATNTTYTNTLTLVQTSAQGGGGGGGGGPVTYPPGTPRYQNYAAPDGLGTTAGEPSLGVNWRTGNVLFGSDLQTLRVSFDDCSSPARARWEDVSAPTSVESLDPILFTDCKTGRTIVSQLLGPSNASSFSDNDGATWTPGGVVATNAVDHQTVGGGVFSTNPLVPITATTAYTHAVYYCSQGIADASCSFSSNGGINYGPPVPMYTISQCGGLHGHVKVDPNDGTVYVPNKSCGGTQGMAVSTNDGASFTVVPITSSTASTWDPSIGIGSQSTIYFGYRNGDGHPHVAVLKNHGQQFVNDIDVGTSFGLQRIAFPEMVAGDDNRAAFAFLGTKTGGDDSLGNSINFEWHLYIASTFDGGQTWTTVDATPNDPVQRGPICSSGTICSSTPNTRNLLDFMDIQVDAVGRVLVGYADGCIASCDTVGMTQTNNSFSDLATIARQSGGMRLFHQYDPSEPTFPGAPLITATLSSATGYVTVSWPEPDNGGSPITGYHVYRSTTPNTAPSAATLIGTVNGSNPTNTFVDMTAQSGVTYYYKVTAFNANGESPPCREVVPVLTVLESSCSTPGITVATGMPGHQKLAPANADLNILSVSVAEPATVPASITVSGSLSNFLVFTMKLADLSTLVPGHQWRFLFYPGTSGFYVGMDYTAPGQVSYTYGSLGSVGIVGNQPTMLGAADGGTYSVKDNTITIVIDKSKVGNPQPDSGFQVSGRTYQNNSGSVALLQTSAVDFTGSGNYPVSGNAQCATLMAGTPSATVPAMSSATNTSIVSIATSTKTPVPPTATPTNTNVPSANTPVPPTATPTKTPVPPTNTPTNTLVPGAPTNTPTNTLVPGAPTNTPIPPTTTSTSALPASTSTPVSSASGSAATSTPVQASVAATVQATVAPALPSSVASVIAPVASVIAPVETALPSSGVVRPTIAVDPGSASPGDRVTVTGQGFEPGETVTLALNGAALLTTPATVHADRDGRFTASVVAPDGLLDGANSVSAIGVESRISALAGLVGRLPFAARFYFAGGLDTTDTHSTLQLLNPSGKRAAVALTFYFPDGKTHTARVAVAPRSQTHLALASLLGRSGSFGLSLIATTQVAAQLALVRPGKDGDAILGNTGTGATWYLAEGYTGLTFKESVSILNPDQAHAVHVTLRLLALGGKGSRSVRVTVPAHTHATVDVSRLLPGRSLSIVATSDRGIVVERALTFSRLGSGRGAGNGYGLTTRAGINVAATSWLFAEGSTANRFETFLTVLNPGAQAARVTARFYGRSGRLLASRTITVAGLSRANIRLNGLVHASGIASTVMADRPIVVERPEYFGSPNGARIAGSDVFGLNGGAARWSFAGGDTTANSEFLLLFNPSAQAIPVALTFYGDNGAMVNKTVTLRPNERATLDVRRLAPGLATLHGVMLQSTDGQGFVVEQTVFAPNLTTLRTTQGLAQ